MSRPTNSLSTLKNTHEISRENFWTEVRDRLNQAADLAEFIVNYPLALIIQNGNLVVDYNFFDDFTIKLLVDPYDMRTAPFDIIANGTYEKFEAFLLHTLSKQINNFVDIGANIGFYALTVARLNSTCTVYAFEPNLNIYSRLEENLHLNGIVSNVKTFNIGVGLTNDSVSDFFIPKFTGSGGGSLRNLHPEEGEPIKISVKINSLDSILANKNVDLMKIDVEGNEYDVIAGGIALIKNSKPTIFVELLRKWMKPFGHHPQEIIDLVGQIGYNCYGIKENSLIKLETIDDKTIENNFIFCHAENTETINFLEGFLND